MNIQLARRPHGTVNFDGGDANGRTNRRLLSAVLVSLGTSQARGSRAPPPHLSRAMDVALEDINFLLSDLDLGVVGHQDGEDNFKKSSVVVTEQVRILEAALALQPDSRPEAAGDIGDGAGILDVAIARGMPRPDGNTDDSTARYRNIIAYPFLFRSLQ